MPSSTEGIVVMGSMDTLADVVGALAFPGNDADIHAGVDMVDLDEFRRILATGGEVFLAAVYTAQEQAHCDGRLGRLAARFAAKEAAAKTLGTGFRGIGPLDIEVVSEANGRPGLVFHGRASDRAQALGITSVSVSLSDTKTAAVAFVVAVGAAENKNDSSAPLQKEI
jgi:holo-[acyl-carrier protein] synthase